MAKIRSATARRDPRKSHANLRNAIRRQIYAEQDTCVLCGKPVDVSLPPHQPLSPEIDEIIPVSRGGSPYDIDNCQLVHKICNQRKGNKMAGDDLPKDVNPIPISRNW